MGGGRRELTPNTKPDPEYPRKMGRRTDGKDIIEEWLQEKEDRSEIANYVWKKQDLEHMDFNKTDYLMGNYGHIIGSNVVKYSYNFLVSKMVSKFALPLLYLHHGVI